MFRRFAKLLLLAALVLQALPAMAASSIAGFNCKKDYDAKGGEKLFAGVEKRYAEVKGVEAEFIQYSYFAGLSRGELSKGHVRFLKPGLMDWEYREPSKQRFVADGKVLYFYQPEDNQVTVGDFNNSFQSDLPVSFLLGVGKLQEQFNLQSSCTTERGVLLKLQPKRAADFEEFSLLVSPSKELPLGAQVIDAGGNETTISLLGLEVKDSLKKKMFHFKIPRGVDVIDRRQAHTIKDRRAIRSADIPLETPIIKNEGSGK